MEKKETSIVFTGDIGFDKYMTDKWTDEALLCPEIQRFFDGADHVCANVEGAMILAKDVQSDKGIFFHAMNPEATCFLDRIHADIWNLANNHTTDAGDPGIQSTLRLCAEHSAQKIGAGMNRRDAASPVILNEGGGVGIFGMGYQPTCLPAGDDKAGCLSWDDGEMIRNTIAEIKKTCRWCVAVIHGGEEFDSIPLPYVRSRYLQYLDWGVDVIVGHHPHVPQNYETFENKAIFYSLGNFIFDTDYQRAQMNTDTGILLKLLFTETGFRFEPFGTKLERGPEHLGKGEIPAIFTDLNAEEYAKLSPLAAKAFISNERRRKVFLKPDEFKGCPEEKWIEYFNKTVSVPFAHHDMRVLLWEAAKTDRSAESAHPAVREYLLKQL